MNNDKQNFNEIEAEKRKSEKKTTREARDEFDFLRNKKIKREKKIKTGMSLGNEQKKRIFIITGSKTLTQIKCINYYHKKRGIILRCGNE